ncbi:DUF2956 domain-containing protein [Psychromonas sp. PT13]|uniref:DUF2956 domain-containing protein n=1 Tax=Psychromonas sp. PT13 TaxID=3439547 RepID=UPI003EBA43F7
MAKHKTDVSQETQNEAMQIAKKTQKQGQTKEQTRLIAQGIQKGIAEYKKTIKSKQRQADKAKKKHHKQTTENEQPVAETQPTEPTQKSTVLPWSLLIISWLGFAAYLASHMNQ